MPYYWEFVSSTVATTTDNLVFARIQDDILWGALIGLVIGLVYLVIKKR